MGTGFLITRYYPDRKDIKIFLHAEDQFLWDNIELQARKFGLNLPSQNIGITDSLTHNETLNICDTKIRVLHTPGHSPGSCTFLLEPPDTPSPVLIVGDVIFQGSIGRTDLWKGDYNTLQKSIHDSILSCSDDTRIIPGHGPDTTVGEERLGNPFLELN